jgi:hypothetical protein
VPSSSSSLKENAIRSSVQEHRGSAHDAGGGGARSTSACSTWATLRNTQNTGRYLAGSDHTLAHVSVGAAIGLGDVLGLGLGIVVSLTADVPFAPEGGVVLGALLGWLSRRRFVS